MYNPAITTALVDAERARTAGFDDPGERFLGVYHSIDEIDKANRHFAGFRNADGRIDPRRKWTAQERQWKVNEKFLCMVDFQYWLTRYAWISNDQNVLVRFNPTRAQRMVISVWSELERRGWAIMMQQLKARQLGVSTLTENAVLHRALFYPDVNAIVASCDDNKSAKMFRMIERCWEEQPWWLIPDMDQHKIGKFLKLENQSSITVDSGNQMSGIGRGDTPQVIHVSEIAEFFDAESLIDSSLLHAVHPHPGTFFVLESTAMGFGNWWETTWQDSIASWNNGTGQLCPMFLPWFVGSDIYPTKTWIRQHPVPANWEPSAKTEKHAKKAALYVKTNDVLHAQYPDGWTMPLEQQWFYEVKYEQAIRKKRLNRFLSEMPSDANEAFQSTNIAAVDVEECMAYRNEAMARPPLAVFGIRGDEEEINLRFQPFKRDLDLKSVTKPVKLQTFLGPIDSQYTLVPLLFKSYDEDPHGRLYVWEWPEDGEEYGIGVDMGDGVGQDRSIIEVVKRYTMHEPWKQVAEFASPYMNSLDFWPIVQSIAIFYSVYLYGVRRQPKICIECRGNGETVQLQLKKYGWTNFHLWVRYDSKKIEPAKSHKLGFFTNSWSRRMMMDKILHLFNNRDIDLRSPWLCDEFKTLDRDENRQQFSAASGCHDDRVMALGIPIWCMDALSMNKRARRRGPVEDEGGDPVYTDPHGRDREVAAVPMERLMRVRPPSVTRPRL